MAESFEHFDLPALPTMVRNKLLTSLILPRPIAWVTSKDAKGVLNAAPFSYFNVLASDPPIIGIGIGAQPDREVKDTLANISTRGEFVVNLVPEELGDAMNLTATNVPPEVDETQLAGLELAASEVVDVPRIAGSPVAMECKVFQLVDTGGTGTIVLAKVVRLHVRSSVFSDVEKLYVDPAQMRLIARMHGASGYCTTREVFDLVRKILPVEK